MGILSTILQGDILDQEGAIKTNVSVEVALPDETVIKLAAAVTVGVGFGIGIGAFFFFLFKKTV